MALVEDFNKKEESKALYALDKLLLYLGLWRGSAISGKSEAERLHALDTLDFSKKFILNGSAYDPEGQQIVLVTSETAYNKESGIFDDKIIFWKHAPYDQTNGAEPSEHYVISWRGRRDPDQSTGELPVILPEQIWLNGDMKFGPSGSGEPADPFDPQYQRLINRVIELSQRVKESLSEREPVQDLARILSDSAKAKNILSELSGNMPFLEGLSEKGGFEKTLTPYFLDVIQEEHETLRLNCKSVDELKAVHGFHVNTVDQGRSMSDQWEKSATHLESGMRFVTRNQYRCDEQSGEHIFSLNVSPENVPHDMPMPESYELVRLAYAYGEDGLFTLKDWNFMDSDKKDFSSLSRQHNLLGLYQKSMNYLNKGKYPPFHDLIHECGLDEVISEFHAPPTLKEGIELLWIPFNGRNMNKQVGPGGDGLGGGNAFLNRYKKENGEWSECGVIIDIPYQPWGDDGDFEGMQPDFHAVWDKCDTIILTHDHFDHSTIEYLAYQGLLKGKKVICEAAVEDIVRTRLDKLGIKKPDYPDFVNFDDQQSGLIKTGKHTYAYSIQDNDGNTRFWNQICRDGAKHSAQVSAHMITGTFNGEQWSETYFNYGDAYEFTEHGIRFAEEGQLGLFRVKEISDAAKEKLLETVGNKQSANNNRKPDKAAKSFVIRDLANQYPDKDFNKLYIAHHDPTNCGTPGHAPRPEDVKANWRTSMQALGGDLLIHVPFSTSMAEIRAMDELIAESATLRHSTDVGANMQIRGAVMNKHGVRSDLDLRNVKISVQHHPQALFDAALEGVEDFLQKRVERAQQAASKRKDGLSTDDMLASDTPYQLLKLIQEKALLEIDHGRDKPKILHDCFMDKENLSIWRSLLEESERPYTDTLDIDSLQTIPKAAFKQAKEAIKQEIIKKLDIPSLQKASPGENFNAAINSWANSNTAYWALKSVEKHGAIVFDKHKPCSRNDYRMYQALMNDQPEASLHYSRTSKIAKFFRNFPEKLMIRVTGPIGSAAEGFATLSRYAHGDSLLDYDEFVRNTGYEISDKTPKTIFVTQTASMGSASELAQSKLMRTLVQNRGDTVFCAYKNGFRIHNPKEKLGTIMSMLKKQGWHGEWDAKNNEIRVHDVPFHIHGHGFMEDLRAIVNHSKAKLHEIVHIPSWHNLITARDIIKAEGGHTSMEEPRDFVGMKAVTDKETGLTRHELTDYLTPSYWLIRLRRKYGQQYGGVVEMVRAIVQRDDGSKRLSGLDVRRSEHGNHQGGFNAIIAHIAQNDFPQAANMDHAASNYALAPAAANIRAPAKPRSPASSTLLALHLKKEKAQGAAPAIRLVDEGYQPDV